MAITEYEDQINELVKQGDHSQFIFDFLSIYDKISRATITKLRKGSNNLAKEPGEVHLKNKLYFKATSEELIKTFSDLEEKINELKSKPRYIIVTDYRGLLAKDTKTNDTLDIEFKNLPQYFDFFLAWNGIEKADLENESPADLKAAERFAKLFDEIVKENKNVSRHGLNLFLVRLLFCLFAEDTGIFKVDAFTNYIKTMTSQDALDMNSRIKELFVILDVKNRKDDVPSYLVDFPYVNGQLFTEPHEDMIFTKKSRQLIIDAGELVGWSKVNPDILGSMLQAVASEDSRSHLGMHYTSVPNIMKVIKPLFLDDLKNEFELAKGNLKKLGSLLNRISNIKFMDPACGSGNFLIITYKELRKLEMDILEEQRKIKPDTFYFPAVDLSQFYGIEIEEFATDVTRLSLWIADHQMNKILEDKFNNVIRPTLPLQKAGDIKNENSLEINWNKFLPHKKNDEIYLFGNPPYLGHSKQTKEQKKEIRKIFNGVKGNGYLDYISAWFKLGADYIFQSDAKLAFVSTNSICQGEQVAILWNELLKKCQINFAYNSFKWANNAKNNAGVTVIIIGLESPHKDNKRKLFKSDFIESVPNISPYLLNGRNILITDSKSPLNGLPEMLFGSKPSDGGGLIFSEEEYKDAIKKFPILSNYFLRYCGAKDFINGFERYVLWLLKSQYEKIKDNPIVKSRIEVVKFSRLKTKTKSTNEWAKKPYMFKQISPCYKDESNIKPSIIIPRVSSENRIYVPMGIVGKSTIIADSAMLIYDAPIWLLGLLESRMHMVWLRSIGGKLKTDYRYSAGLVYNTFPVPELSTRRKNEIEDIVYNILDIRNEEGGSLAELYGSPLAKKNPKPMNPRLEEEHRKLDKVIDRAYKATDFKDDNERLSLLLDMYSDIVSK